MNQDWSNEEIVWILYYHFWSIPSPFHRNPLGMSWVLGIPYLLLIRNKKKYTERELNSQPETILYNHRLANSLKHLFFSHFEPFPLANFPFLPLLWFCSTMTASFSCLAGVFGGSQCSLLMSFGTVVSKDVNEERRKWWCCCKLVIVIT